MNNDRELLELAAKAAGIKISQWSNAQAGGFLPGGRGDFWNPLTDDGHALRLAVSLDIEIKQYKGACIARWGQSGEYYKWLSEPLDNDPYAATRIAIVRAAAEIGKGQK